jgi:hypothetical protein
MNKLIIGEILFIIIFFILYWFHDLKTFMISTILGNIIVATLIVLYFYLDKFLGLLFCLMILFVYYSKSYEPFYTSKQSNFTQAEDAFKKNYCLDGKLIHKGSEVKTEMMSHIFPEISFEDNKICNPCDNNCRFNIIEEDKRKYDETLSVSTLM